MYRYSACYTAYRNRVLSRRQYLYRYLYYNTPVQYNYQYTVIKLYQLKLSIEHSEFDDEAAWRSVWYLYGTSTYKVRLPVPVRRTEY